MSLAILGIINFHLSKFLSHIFLIYMQIIDLYFRRFCLVEVILNILLKNLKCPVCNVLQQ